MVFLHHPKYNISMTESAKINIQGTETELPIVIGTENEVGVDISKLRATTGAVVQLPFVP